MKRMRLLLQCSSAALLCLMSYACVDDAYDTSDVDLRAEIFKNGIDLPIGTLNMTMDTVFKDMDHLTVRNGVYTISIGDNIELGDVSSALSNFTPASIPSPAATTFNMVDGRNLPSTPQAVANGTIIQTGSTSIGLPSFSTSLMNPVDSILLNNTTITMLASTKNFGGTGLSNSITITCTPTGNVAEFYDIATNQKITSWTLKGNVSKQIGIRMIKPAAGNSIGINYSADLTVSNANPVTITAKDWASISLAVTVSAVDFKTVYGKAHYSKTDTQKQAIDGFKDLAEGGSVLSFYNPTLKLYTNSNLGVPVKLNLNLSSKNTTSGATATLNSAAFTIQPPSTPALSKTNVLTIDQQTNGLANIFKINPDEMTIGYSIQTDQATSNHFVNKSTFLTIADTVEIPFKFNNDFRVSIGDTIDNPFIDILDQLDDQDSLSFGFALKVTNRIPLGMKINLIAMNDNMQPRFTITSANIGAGTGIDANGFATQETVTNTTLAFSKDQINQFRELPKFRVEFVVAANQNSSFVAIRPQDYIKIEVSGVVRGGMILDLNKKNTDN